MIGEVAGTGSRSGDGGGSACGCTPRCVAHAVATPATISTVVAPTTAMNRVHCTVARGRTAGVRARGGGSDGVRRYTGPRSGTVPLNAGTSEIRGVSIDDGAASLPLTASAGIDGSRSLMRIRT